MLTASDVREPLNIGSEQLVTINELVDIVEGIAGVTLERKYNLSAPQGVRGRNSDNTLITKKLGWAPAITLEYGMARTYEWIHEQMPRRGHPHHAANEASGGANLAGAQPGQAGAPKDPQVCRVMGNDGAPRMVVHSPRRGGVVTVIDLRRSGNTGARTRVARRRCRWRPVGRRRPVRVPPRNGRPECSQQFTHELLLLLMM